MDGSGSIANGLLNDRIERLPPILVRIIHHDVNEHRHQESEDGCAVADLCAVDGAIPCCPAMDQLIAQNVEPVKNKAQHAGRVCGLNGLRETAGRGVETIFPVVITMNSVSYFSVSLNAPSVLT